MAERVLVAVVEADERLGQEVQRGAPEPKAVGWPRGAQEPLRHLDPPPPLNSK